MTYGTIKVDTVTFTDAGVDKSVTLSGLVQNPTFSGNVTVTGTLSGVTVTGTTANFTSGNFTNISGGTHTITSGVFAAGSAASPSITFTGDLNTGIYSPGADQVAISTGGSGRLFVDGNGVATGGAPQFGFGGIQVRNSFIYVNEDGANTTQMYLRTSSNEAAIQVATNHPFKIQTNNQERLRITSAGLVGVGTSSPAARLSVSSADNVAATTIADFSANNGTSAIQIGYNRITQVNSTPASAYLQLGVSNKSDAIFIDGTGLVGIGTTAPSYALDVRTTGTSISSLFTSDQSEQYIALKDSGTTIGHVRLGSTSGSMLFFAGNGERGRFDSSGSLLVGTSSSRSTAIGDPRFQVEGTTYGESSVQMICNSAADAFTCAHLAFGRSKTTAIGGTGQVVDGDRLGAISWNGAQNSTLSSIAGLIECYVDGEVQTGGDTTDMPGRLVFSTTADGASSPTERLRITSAGVLQIADAGNIAVGTTTGTKIGTATTQKLGFFNKTPVVQPAAVADATDAASVITQLNALLARMRDLGLIAT